MLVLDTVTWWVVRLGNGVVFASVGASSFCVGVVGVAFLDDFSGASGMPSVSFVFDCTATLFRGRADEDEDDDEAVFDLDFLSDGVGVSPTTSMATKKCEQFVQCAVYTCIFLIFGCFIFITLDTVSRQSL